MLLAGRYSIEGRIGQGGMARVYGARDVETERRVAVKILEPEHFHRPGGVELFLREAAAAQRVRHPNIVETIAVGTRPDGRPYIVMELLEGETLGEYLEREGNMPLDRALFLLTEVAAGLAAANAAGVVHRDVTPHNLFLVGPVGSPFGAKLLDFGLAETESHIDESTAGHAVGTMQYMAPEQVLDDGVTTATDVYGFGVVLFRALTGALPFDGYDEVLVLAHQVWSKPPPPSWLVESLPPGLDSIVCAALRKRPENRYESLDDLRRDLLRVCDAPHVNIETLPMRYDHDAYVSRSKEAARAAEFLKRQLDK